MTASEGRVVADLHVHTTASDGRLDLEDIPAAANRADLDAVAITDHERLHTALDRPVIRRDGVTIVRGIEMRVERETGDRIDLLGYAVSRTDALTGLIDRAQANRVERARHMISLVESELDVSLALDPSPGVGRPHVARAIDRHPDTAYDVQGAFDHLIGADGPCYVPREIPSVEHGASVLAGACPVVSVAHPLRYANVAGALDVARRVGAVELCYPYDETVDVDPIARAVEDHGLLATGGSDSHGRTLGACGLDGPAFAVFRAAARLD